MGVDNWHYHSDTNSYEVRGWSGGEDTGRIYRITFPEGCGVETHSNFRASTQSAEPNAITDQVLRLLGSRVRTTESALDLLDTATEAAYGDGEGAAPYWALNDAMEAATTQTFTAEDAAMLAKAVSDNDDDGYADRHGYAARPLVHTGSGKTFTEADALVAFRKLVGTRRTRR